MELKMKTTPTKLINILISLQLDLLLIILLGLLSSMQDLVKQMNVIVMIRRCVTVSRRQLCDRTLIMWLQYLTCSCINLIKIRIVYITIYDQILMNIYHMTPKSK